MKTVILFVAMLLGISACNKCYKCGSSSVTCSTEFINNESWAGTEEFIKKTNGCVLIEPTDKVELCDNNIKNIIVLYERENYYCD